MSKFSQKRYRNVGELSSKYAYDKDGTQFDADILSKIERSEQLYNDFVKFMKERNVIPSELRTMFTRYYEDFLKG
jgi:hypothetical protein